VVLVIGNTVRLAIENRRAEIVVTKLVGGTDAYVSRPFLYTGLWYGAGGGLLAIILISLVMFGLKEPVLHLAGVYDSSFSMIGLGITNSFLVFTVAGLLGWFGAWISVLRHLRAIEPR
jgi:cell division transport system permease protein